MARLATCPKTTFLHKLSSLGGNWRCNNYTQNKLPDFLYFYRKINSTVAVIWFCISQHKMVVKTNKPLFLLRWKDEMNTFLKLTLLHEKVNINSPICHLLWMKRVNYVNECLFIFYFAFNSVILNFNKKLE